MIAAARSATIIAEPVRNLATSRLAPVAQVGRRFTDPGSGEQEYRFDEDSLDALMAGYRHRIRDSFLIPGGREKVFVLAGPPTAC